MRPLFILSNPRSGSSLLRILLNHQPNSVFPPECGFIQWLFPKYKNFKISQLDEFIEELSKTKKIEGWKLDFPKLKEFILTSMPTTYQNLCFRIYEFYGLKSKKEIKVWGDKNNYYINHLETLKEIYPEAKFIHLIRDGRDVCVSYLNLDKIKDSLKYKPRVPNKIPDILKEYKNNINKIERFLETLSKKKVLTLRYEDLLKNPSNVLNIIGLFTGENFSNSLDNFNSKKYFDEPSITLEWKKKTKELIDPTNCNLYLDHKKSQEIIIHSHLIDDILKKYYS